MQAQPIYMFHAIGSGRLLDGADPHYAYSISNFGELISLLNGGTSLKNALKGNNNQAILTFDDGHASNYEAARILKEEFNSTADFFINTSTIGSKNFLSWQQVKDMHSWGMSIQSHGHEHKYLSDMSRDEQQVQLKRCKELIEDQISDAVTIMAPPGGRYNQDTLDLVHDLGYEHISISKPGRWSGGNCSPRIPVYANSKADVLATCKNRFSPYLIKQIIKYQTTGLAKSLLGNESYDSLRSKILGA